MPGALAFGTSPTVTSFRHSSVLPLRASARKSPLNLVEASLRFKKMFSLRIFVGIKHLQRVHSLLKFECAFASARRARTQAVFSSQALRWPMGCLRRHSSSHLLSTSFTQNPSPPAAQLTPRGSYPRKRHLHRRLPMPTKTPSRSFASPCPSTIKTPSVRCRYAHVTHNVCMPQPHYGVLIVDGQGDTSLFCPGERVCQIERLS